MTALLTRFRTPRVASEISILTLIAVALLSNVTALRSQIIGAAVSGHVRDPSRGRISGATIELTNKNNEFMRSTVTDNEGRYSVAGLDPGVYDIRFVMDGFNSLLMKDQLLLLGTDSRLDVEMETGASNTLIESTSALPEVLRSGLRPGGVIDDRELASLPLASRSFDSLAALQPGMARTITSPTLRQRITFGSGASLSATGAPQTYTGFLLDGTDTQNHAGMNPAGITGTNLGLETLAQVQVISGSASAEYGRVGAAIVSTATRTGTRDWHGSAFEFNHTDNLDAARWEEGAFFGDDFELPGYVRNQFGGTIGGPVPGSSTLLLAAYEGSRARFTIFRLGVVPDSLARQGIISGGFGGQQIRIAPAVVPYLNAYPLPNGRAFFAGVGEYFDSISLPTDQNFGSLRLDHQLANGHRVYGRISVDDANEDLPDDLPIARTVLRSRQAYTTVGITEPLGARLLNVARVAFNRTNPSLTPENDFPTLAFRPGQPWAVSVTGLSTLGNTQPGPVRFVLNSYEVTDDLQWNRGSHILRFGGRLQRMDTNNHDANVIDAFSFPNLANFLQGVSNRLQGAAEGSNPTSGFRQWLGALYFQDQWALGRDLTANLGLRYETVSVPSEVNGNEANIVDVLRDRAVTRGASIENPSRADFAPRAGLAWAPFGLQNTVLRAGAGVYYNQITGRIYTSNARTGFYNGVSIPLGFVQSAQFPSFSIPAQFGVAALINAFERNPSTPTIYQWNAVLEHELPLDIVASAGYVGSHGSHWTRFIDANIAPHTVLNDGRIFFPGVGNFGATRTNPALGAVRMIVTDANADAHALELHVGRRSLHGFSGQFSYTMLRAVNEATGFDAVQTPGAPLGSLIPFEHTADRSRSSYEQRHVAHFTFTYAVPGATRNLLLRLLTAGWEVHGLGTMNSGVPFTARVSVDTTRSLASFNTQRPDLAPGASNNPVIGSVDRWFDTAGFRFPQPGFYGNVGRNTIDGPGLATVDLAVGKRFAIRETHSLAFRAEAYNLFNRPNFGLPDAVVFDSALISFPGGVQGRPSPGAGRVFSTVTPSRQIQLSLRYSF